MCRVGDEGTGGEWYHALVVDATAPLYGRVSDEVTAGERECTIVIVDTTAIKVSCVSGEITVGHGGRALPIRDATTQTSCVRDKVTVGENEGAVVVIADATAEITTTFSVCCERDKVTATKL